MAGDDPTRPAYSDSRPFYETIELRSLVLAVVLAAQSVSMWFLTAATLKVSYFPPDSQLYLAQLPATYWWGIGTTLAFLGAARLLDARWRTLLEVSSLFLLALYVFGLPSFTYENPRILDTYAHTSSSLLILDTGGWQSASWIARQFPGAYTYFAQIISVTGLSPFDLMKYYVVGISWVVILSLYVIARIYSRNYCAIVSALFIGGMWFQLHLSPQSLELISYLGILYVLLKMVADKPRRKAWTKLAIACVPGFVVSHPETPVMIILGAGASLVLAGLIPFVKSRRTLRDFIPTVGPFLIVLLVATVVWWSTFGSSVMTLIETVAGRAVHLASSQASLQVPTLPSTPAYGFQTTVMLEEGVSATFWLFGVALLVLFRGKLRPEEYLLIGLFLTAVSTTPLTLFVRADMLVRSYLFSLLPGVILAAWLLERGSFFRIRGRSLYTTLKVALILFTIVFLLLIPVTRYGVDPYEYIPQSSLAASNVATGLTSHANSVLVLANGEYGWRLYAAINGDTVGLRDERANMTGLAGAFVKTGSEVTIISRPFNLEFTKADESSDYILLSGYYENLYLLRYGQQSSYYTGPRDSFEGHVALHFDLVYSSGTDRIYANRNLTALM